MDLIQKVSIAERADQAKRKADESRVMRAMAELDRRRNQPRVEAERRAAKRQRVNRLGSAKLENMRKQKDRKARAAEGRPQAALGAALQIKTGDVREVDDDGRVTERTKVS